MLKTEGFRLSLIFVLLFISLATFPDKSMSDASFHHVTSGQINKISNVTKELRTCRNGKGVQSSGASLSGLRYAVPLSKSWLAIFE